MLVNLDSSLCKYASPIGHELVKETLALIESPIKCSSMVVPSDSASCIMYGCDCSNEESFTNVCQWCSMNFDNTTYGTFFSQTE